MKTQRLNRENLLSKLERIKYEPGATSGDEQLRQMNMADALLALAYIDHDHEYELCAKVAQHLLGKIPEPDDIPVPEE
jgi:hypothetical protein